MDRKTQRKFLTPDYKKIYSDMITKKFPDKKKSCEKILSKQELSVMDVIVLNSLIFGTVGNQNYDFNQKCRSYDKKTIFFILDYQKKKN
ncbi:hypothetical protein SAMN02787100_1916 [Chryseobacterium sp. OV279]|nr:hypothetical protein SAMN02787100_1916 [Chryseobacterium sp. OV279]